MRWKQPYKFAMDQALLDQLHAARFPLATTPATDSATGSFYRPAQGSDALFSAQSHRTTDSEGWFEARPIASDRWGVSVVALGILVLYCWVVSRYRKAIVTSSKSVLSLEDTFVVFDHMPHEFHRFLSFSRLLLVSGVALFVVLSPGGGVSGGQALLYWVGVLAFLYASLAIQRLLLWLVARFDAMPDRLLMLRNLYRIDWAVVSVFFPLVVVSTLGYDKLWYGALAVLSVAVLFHWVRLFSYFRCAGFSILQWFLYLCTLEALPFTLLWGLGRTVGSFY